MGRDREIAGLILLFRYKLCSSKGTSSRYFTTIRGRFVLDTARVKALGWLEKKNQKRKMTKHDFHHFQVRHFNNVFEQSWCHCRVGCIHQRGDLTVFSTRRIHHQVKYWRLNANTCIVAAILFSGHPYIGRHCRASLIKIHTHVLILTLTLFSLL